jgi:hypothetical protein
MPEGMEYRKYCCSRIAKDVFDTKVLQTLNQDFCSIHFFHPKNSRKETELAQDVLFSIITKNSTLEPE